MKINELFVSYELALLARKYEFNQECVGYYFGKDREIYVGNNDVYGPFNFKINSTGGAFNAPTYDQLVEWFLINKQIGIEIALDETLMWVYKLTPLCINNVLNKEEQSYFTYSTRREALIKALEHIFALLDVKY